MKKVALTVLILIFLFCLGCSPAEESFRIVATTLPVYEFTAVLCDGTDLSVGRLVTDNVSCLHDYTLQVTQMRMVEDADVIVISGAGLEGFLDDALHNKDCIDASLHLHIHSAASHDHDDHGHAHDADPHIWLSPENAKGMAENICEGLSAKYPAYGDTFHQNLEILLQQLDALQTYGETTLSQLSCREIITFHDGFGYFAESFDLEILEAVEEEAGSEASAMELIHLSELIQAHGLPAIFTERSGSTASASIISRETNTSIYTLDMAMAGESYFDAMYHNIDTVKEALK